MVGSGCRWWCACGVLRCTCSVMGVGTGRLQTVGWGGVVFGLVLVAVGFPAWWLEGWLWLVSVGSGVGGWSFGWRWRLALRRRSALQLAGRLSVEVEAAMAAFGVRRTRPLHAPADRLPRSGRQLAFATVDEVDLAGGLWFAPETVQRLPAGALQAVVAHQVAHLRCWHPWLLRAVAAGAAAGAVVWSVVAVSALAGVVAGGVVVAAGSVLAAGAVLAMPAVLQKQFERVADAVAAGFLPGGDKQLAAALVAQFRVGLTAAGLPADRAVPVLPTGWGRLVSVRLPVRSRLRRCGWSPTSPVP